MHAEGEVVHDPNSATPSGPHRMRPASPRVGRSRCHCSQRGNRPPSAPDSSDEPGQPPHTRGMLRNGVPAQMVPVAPFFSARRHTRRRSRRERYPSSIAGAEAARRARSRPADRGTWCRSSSAARLAHHTWPPKRSPVDRIPPTAPVPDSPRPIADRIRPAWAGSAQFAGLGLPLPADKACIHEGAASVGRLGRRTPSGLSGAAAC